MSDNRLAPKLFLPILAALSTARSIKSLNLSWNLLLEKARAPQIGTYVREERIVQHSKEPITFPPPQASAQDPRSGVAGNVDPTSLRI